jgi:regulator of sigma E protease
MTTVLVFAVVVSILVVVHELGHCLVAKWFGVPVDVFSVGFGPRLLAVRRGGTEYRLSAIPFGGYVKMAGMSSKSGEATPNGFDSKARWQRLLILFAGPAMNILFALVLAIVGLWAGIELPVEQNGVVTTAFYRPEPLAAIPIAVQVIASNSLDILRTLGGLMTGEVPVNHLIGPVGLAQIAGESSALGWRALLAAMAFVSLNLGICNLLPIPVLDGGHMLMLMVESATGRSISSRTKRTLIGAGAAVMLVLLIATFYNDLGRLGTL